MEKIRPMTKTESEYLEKLASETGCIGIKFPFECQVYHEDLSKLVHDWSRVEKSRTRAGYWRCELDIDGVVHYAIFSNQEMEELENENRN